MTKEIYISSTPHETRLAVVEDDQLAEIYYERENEYTLAGSVYKGKVTRVLPGMQSAFVDIGLERDAFLYVTDFAEEQEDGEEYVALSPGSSQSQRHGNGSGRSSASPPANAGTIADASNQPNAGQKQAAGAPHPPSSAGETEEDAGPGARRWRGRRGRRRGRGNPLPARTSGMPGTVSDEPSSSPDLQPKEAIELELGEIGDPGIYPEFPAGASEESEHYNSPQSSRPERASEISSRHQSAPNQPLILPGESLSKYGRKSVSQPSEATAAPATGQAAPASTFQPSTMVVAPLAWDGSALLPGESISRYKNKSDHSAADVQTTPPVAQSKVDDETNVSSSPAAEIGARTIEDNPATHSPKSETAAASETNILEPSTEDHTLHEHLLREHPIVQHPLNEPNEVASQASEHSAAGPAAVDTANSSEAEIFEPEEASASYRFDPSAPSAYRQSNVAEPATAEAKPAPSEEKSTPEHPEFEPPENARRQAVLEESASESKQPEPFFGESVSIAQPVDTQQATQQPATSSLAAETAAHFTEAPSGPQAFTQKIEDAESSGEEPDESESASEHGVHSFDPGHGYLEEEMIDEDEPEPYTAQAAVDDVEYDDLIEETLDVQMDSGLLSELVRDKHIDQRTRFTEEPGDEPVSEDDSFAGEAAGFDDDSAGIELEEFSDSDEEVSEHEASNADATRPRSNGPRNQRRGIRGQRPGQGGNRGGRMRRSTAQMSNLPAITELLKPNQEILVQIAKEPIARKGARITSHIALPGRFLVFMPTVNHVGVSRKISSDEERQRLKHILVSEKGTASGGFIVRTAAATASEEDLRADIRFLLTLWAEIKQRADSSKPPALIYHDLSLVERVLRDQVTDNFSAIWVDSEQDYERVLRFLNRFEPSLVRRVKLYTKETPLFEQFGIQEEINKALRSKVWLKSGGSIVINQTEALVAIDINTGKYVGKTARLEDTILKTNLDAIPEIVRQIRLRDLGGIIVIDFIDMDERKNRGKVMQVLEDALKSDRAPSKVLQFNDFGLVAITRKRVKQSLERTLSVPCTTCTGTGMVKGPLTVCNEIYIELRKMHRQLDRGDVLLRVNPEVVKQLKATNGRWLSEMEEMSGKTIIVKSDATLHPEQFDIH